MNHPRSNYDEIHDQIQDLLSESVVTPPKENLKKLYGNLQRTLAKYTVLAPIDDNGSVFGRSFQPKEGDFKKSANEELAAEIALHLFKEMRKKRSNNQQGSNTGGGWVRTVIKNKIVEYNGKKCSPAKKNLLRAVRSSIQSLADSQLVSLSCEKRYTERSVGPLAGEARSVHELPLIQFDCNDRIVQEFIRNARRFIRKTIKDEICDFCVNKLFKLKVRLIIAEITRRLEASTNLSIGGDQENSINSVDEVNDSLMISGESRRNPVGDGKLSDETRNEYRNAIENIRQELLTGRFRSPKITEKKLKLLKIFDRWLSKARDVIAFDKTIKSLKRKPIAMQLFEAIKNKLEE